MAVSVATAVRSAVAIALTSVVATAPRPSQPAVGNGAEQGTDGSTTRNIAAELRIGTGRLRTDLGARPAVILLPTARLVPGNSWVDRVAIWPATASEEPAWAIEAEEEAWATGRVEVERIASEAETSRVAAAETAMPSEEVPEGTTDRTPVPAAAAAPPAWDREAEASVAVAAVVGADRTLGARDRSHRSTE